MLPILLNKNVLWLFIGRLITNIGDSLYYVASMWLVFTLSDSSFYTGLAGFLILLPKALQFLTGPFVDRWAIKKTLVITQLLQAVLICLLPLAYAVDMLTVPFILTVMPLIACIEEFAYPSQTKALPLLVEKERLVDANGLFSFAYQGVDLLCNALAGMLVMLVGAVTVYLIDSVTFAIAALCFSLVTIPAKRRMTTDKPTMTAAAKSYAKDLREGFSVVFRSFMYIFLIGSTMVNLCIGMSMAVMPAFSSSYGGAEMYGGMQAAMAGGSLIGALLGSVLGKYNIGVAAILSFFLGGVAWMTAALVPIPTVTIICFALAWIPMGAVNVLLAGVTQSMIPNRLLGRVNSVMTSMSVVSMPIGSLAGGYLATLMGSHLLFTLSGTGLFAIAVVWLLHPTLRQLPKAKEMEPSTFGF
ncbi:MFS transporter [Aureibacillus halotolerans]|uniref:Transmembrane secretion effector n=1 Tax=Aureibacillus halotolerans TaxID=1508390 RepID=A0A4R6UCC3_9BACI|nr:MFS transporter [Aureibacillus halotolerans]TDQ42659.1 transmembrane secretion effector [Aureibacillus halotolerans]